MKKIFSILFATLIFVTGMHISVSQHFCGGKIASVKISFTGKKATCGMVDSKNNCPVNNHYTSDCCRNEVEVFSVNNNFTPSYFQNIELTRNLLQKIFISNYRFLYSTITCHSFYSDIGPPGKLFPNDISLAGICVFRI